MEKQKVNNLKLFKKKLHTEKSFYNFNLFFPFVFVQLRLYNCIIEQIKDIFLPGFIFSYQYECDTSFLCIGKPNEPGVKCIYPGLDYTYMIWSHVELPDVCNYLGEHLPEAKHDQTYYKLE